MAGENDTHTYKTLLLCKGQELIMSPTQGQAVVIVVTFDPAISKNLKAFLYGWLPLSNAYGISFLATKHIIKQQQHFLPLQHDTKTVTLSGFR